MLTALFLLGSDWLMNVHIYIHTFLRLSFKYIHIFFQHLWIFIVHLTKPYKDIFIQVYKALQACSFHLYTLIFLRLLLCFVPSQFYLCTYVKYKCCIHVFLCFVTKHSWCYCIGLPTAGVTAVCYHAQIFHENVIWTSLINTDVEYFVIHLFTSWISYFENCLF